MGASQVLAVLGDVGKVRGQFPLNDQRLATGRVGLGWLPQFLLESTQVVVREGQVLAVLGDVGKVGGELVAYGKRLAEGGLRLGPAARASQQNSPGAVSIGLVEKCELEGFPGYFAGID